MHVRNRQWGSMHAHQIIGVKTTVVEDVGKRHACSKHEGNQHACSRYRVGMQQV